MLVTCTETDCLSFVRQGLTLLVVPVMDRLFFLIAETYRGVASRLQYSQNVGQAQKSWFNSKIILTSLFVGVSMLLLLTT